MSNRDALRACLAVCLLLVVGLSAGARQQQDKSPFEFAGASEPVALAAGGETKVQVLNNTTKPLDLAVAILDEHADGLPPLSSFAGVTQNNLTLPPAGGATIVLRSRAPEELEPGASLKAQLVVSDSVSGAVKRRDIQLARPAKRTAATALTSAATSVEATLYFWPGSFGDSPLALDAPLPLNAKVAHDKLGEKFKDDPSLGLLADKSGKTAVVQYSRAEDGLPGDKTGIVLALKGGGAPGKYEGTLSEISTEDKKPVKLTVTAAHHWLLPALAGFAGILIYYAMQRYLNVGRRVKELSEQEAALGVSFALAAENFARAAAGRAYAKDTIGPDFEKQRAALLKKIEWLRLSNFLRLDENSETYKDVIKQLGELDALARDCSAFAESKLNPLHDALNSARLGFGQRPPDPSLAQQQEPAVASQVVAVLEARPAPTTIGEFKARSARADELLPRLAAWARLNGRAAQTLRRYDDIIKAPAFGQRDPVLQAQIRTERRQALTHWRTLWTSGSFDPAALDTELSTLDTSLATLAAESADASAADLTPADGDRDVRVEVRASPAERVRSLARERLGWDVFYLAIVTAVAVYSGLTTLYFDRPFGTWRDYLGITVWGFSTKVVIDAVAGAINRLRPSAVR